MPILIGRLFRIVNDISRRMFSTIETENQITCCVSYLRTCSKGWKFVKAWFSHLQKISTARASKFESQKHRADLVQSPETSKSTPIHERQLQNYSLLLIVIGSGHRGWHPRRRNRYRFSSSSTCLMYGRGNASGRCYPASGSRPLCPYIHVGSANQNVAWLDLRMKKKSSPHSFLSFPYADFSLAFSLPLRVRSHERGESN